MNIPIELSETTRIDNEGNVRTYATLDADALLERLNSGGMEEQEAANRIRELEARLKFAEAKAHKWERLFRVRCEQADERDSEVSDQFTLLANAEKESRNRATAAEAEAARLRGALEAYPEWTDDDPDGYGIGTMQRFVTCLVCGGGGAFRGDGRPSKRIPPTHKPDCARQAALSGQECASFAEQLAAKQIDLPEGVQRAVNENFHELFEPIGEGQEAKEGDGE